jgi:hypothetical protein
MFDYYLAALLRLRKAQDLAGSVLPDAPVQPDPEDRSGERDRRASRPAPPPPNRLDQELDAWEAAHGWLYR